MRPSPFTGKFKRKQIKIQKDKPQQNRQQQQVFDQNPKQNENNSLKPPSARNLRKIPKSIGKQQSRQKSKQIKRQPQTTNIDKQDEEIQKLQNKASAAFKPNLKLKTGVGKKLKISSHQQPSTNQVRKQQQPEQPQFKAVLKPTLFRKNQQGSQRRSQNRQQVVIGEQEHTRYAQNGNHNNGLNIHEQDSYQGSGANHSMSMAPKFKIKQKQQNSFPVIHEQPMQQTGFGVTNFADLKIQTRQINIDTTQIRVSQVKKQKQQSRVKQLSKLLILQPDLFEQTLNISCVTPYQIYINKIKSGSLTNSNDQSFDDKTTSYTQTLISQYQQFTNQCPQDYHADATSIIQQDKTQLFNRFITKIAPVLQQLIKPSNTVVMPPIFLLSLRPQFRKLITNCPFPVFVYYSKQLDIGIAVIGEKLYIVQDQIESMAIVGSNLVAGCRNGTVCIWTGKNDKRSRLYRKVLQHTQTTNFQLPQSTSQQLDRFSIYRTVNPIVSILVQSSQQFTSLDSSCKITKWKINRISRTNNSVAASATPILQPYAAYQFLNMLQRSNLIGYFVKQRNQKYFIVSSAGILVWNSQQIVQRLDTEGFQVVDFALPYRTNFIYVICEDSSIRIYQQHYANQLYKIHIPNTILNGIFIPQTQYENKKLSLTSKVYVTTTDGNIYSLNLLKNTIEPSLLTESHHDKKDRDVIYRGVNKLNNSFQLISLWRDLKCTTQIKKMDVNVQPNVNNIKSILQENKLIHAWLETQNCITIVE